MLLFAGNDDKLTPHAVKTSYQELAALYEAQGKPYGITPHRYWSVGAYPFTVVHKYTDGAGFVRYSMRCPQGTQVEFFGYAQKDEVGGFGLPSVNTNFRASIAETNLLNRRQTNNEDFAIDGISMTAVGYRVAYPAVLAATNTALGMSAGTTATDPLGQLVGQGSNTFTDPASTVCPPEVSSALVLQDTLMNALRGKVSLQIFWDQKASDYLCLFADTPEGGPQSYLLAHGEPAVHNYYRLKDGWTWFKSDGKRDKDMSIIGRVEQDAWIFVTLPPLNQVTSPVTGELGDIQTLWLNIKLACHGCAFYWPSQNV